MKKLVAIVALGAALAAPASAQAWGVVGDQGVVSAFAVVQIHYVGEGTSPDCTINPMPGTCGVLYTTLAYTKDVAECPAVTQYDTGNVDGFVYLEDTGNSFGGTGFDHLPALGDSVTEVAMPDPVSPSPFVFDPIYADGTVLCIPMIGTLPTVDINGVSIMEGTTVLANTALHSNVIRKSVTLQMKDAGAHYLHNTVRVFNAAGKLVASGKHLGLGIRLSASLTKGHTYKVIFRASGYTHTKTVTRKVTVR